MERSLLIMIQGFVRGISLLVALILATPTNAGPINWAKHHKRFLFIEGAALTGAAIHYKGLNHCRKVNGPEPCDEKYGSAYPMFWTWTGLSAIAFPAIAEGCWKDNPDAKFCNLFAYGSSVTQASWGIHEWSISKPRRDNEHPRP